jgi:hypothetical protein
LENYPAQVDELFACLRVFLKLDYDELPISCMRKIITTFILPLLCYLFVAAILPQTVSAVISSASDQLERLNESAASGHTIKFVTSTGITAGQTIVVNFPASIFTFGGAYDFNDMALAEGSSSNCETATFTPKTLAGTPSGTTWGATYASDVVTFTSGTGIITANRCVRITLSTNGGTHALTNPSVGSNTSYVLSIIEAAGDSGSLAIIILNDAGTPDSDQIELQTSVASNISFDVDVAATDCENNTETAFGANVIAFGTLAPSVVKYSDTTIKFVCLDVATNSPNGVDVFVQSARASTNGGLNRTGGGDTIVSSTADLNSGGVPEGYGARVSSTGTPLGGSFSIVSPFNSGSAGNVGLIPGTSSSPAILVSSTAPVETDATSRIAIEIGAKSSADTSAGNYADTLTFTATLNF